MGSLYEIDGIISRTVTYTLVAGLLTVLYADTVFGLTRLVPATGDMAVAPHSPWRACSMRSAIGFNK
ncbi:MAG: hypothetical protein ACRDWA_00415 [Acidimicrobiia bacterium]